MLIKKDGKLLLLKSVIKTVDIAYYIIKAEYANIEFSSHEVAVLKSNPILKSLIERIVDSHSYEAETVPSDGIEVIGDHF